MQKHGVKIHQFPEDILEAGAKASGEVLEELRSSKDPLAKKTVESYLSALALLRQRTQNMETPYLRAREKYFNPK